MNRVLAEGVFKAVWPWGHNRKEAVGTEFLQAQGRDYDCVPFTNVCINGHVHEDSRRVGNGLMYCMWVTPQKAHIGDCLQ